MKKFLIATALAVIVASPVLAGPIYSFKNITHNNLGDAAIGEAQLSVEVMDLGGTQVNFVFSNIGSAACSITDVYFDDGTLLGIADVSGTGIVNFTQDSLSPVSPKNLPGGNTIGFQVTQYFAADSDSPVVPNGVNPGETLTITFNLINGQTFSDTIAALDGGSDLRIGIKVQGFASGGSEGFVNNPSVPEPGSILLGIFALGAGFVGFRRKLR